MKTSAALATTIRHVAEVRRSLATVRADDGPVADAVVRELRNAFRASFFHGHRPALVDGRWRLESLSHASEARWAHAPAVLDVFMASAPASYTTFDPLLPSPDERNRVAGTEFHRKLFRDGTLALVRGFHEPMGLTRLHHQRVLVCDGPLLLRWLGGAREEPFSAEEEALLESLALPFARRLRVDRMLGGAASLDAVAQALDAVDVPAYLVRGDGAVEMGNAPGLSLLYARGAALGKALAEAARRANDTDGFEVTNVQDHGAPRLALVVLRGADHVRFARLDVLRRAHGLTARELEVLDLLARGDANKDIATKLRVSVRTVDVHVRSVLQKCSAGSRAELVARIWTR